MRLSILALVAALLLAALPTAAFAASGSAQAESAAANGTWYIVKRGDTLGEIARYYGVTVQAIKDANHLESSTIHVHQRLYIPPARYAVSCKSHYVVKRGDNLTRIAHWYGISVDALATANGLHNASLIVVGQVLCIPNQYAVEPYGHSHGGHDGWHPGGHDGWHPGGHDGGHSGGGCWYVVRKGDNLSRIAARHGMSWGYLAEINSLTYEQARYIQPGQHLYVCH